LNILKEEALVDQGFYQRVYRQFDFEKAWIAVQSGAGAFRHFKLAHKGNRLEVTPVETVQFLGMVSALAEVLPLLARSDLMAICKAKTFALTAKKAILCHLNADVLIPLATLKHPEHLSELQRSELIEHLKLSSAGADFEKRLNAVTVPPEQRSNMHTFNKASVLVDLEDPKSSRNLGNLKTEHYSLVHQVKVLRYIEVPEGFEPAKLTAFLVELKKASDQIALAYPAYAQHKVALKLRKIRRTHKFGMYVPATGTALVDPRHTDSMWHELGHWVHSWAHPEITKLEDCEAFAEGFKARLFSILT
jgi:hypothetical protein